MTIQYDIEKAAKLLPVGTKGMYGEYPAIVVAHYYDMLEIRVPGGITCVAAQSFKPDISQ
jgi:hypothetical protein